MSDSEAQRFLELFPSNPASFVQGYPTTETKLTPHGPKRIYRYTNIKRPPSLIDAQLHLDGKVSVVANPLLPDGRCQWAAAESDEYNRMAGFLPPDDLKSILNFFPSKSGGVHAFLILRAAWPADIVRRKMIEFAKQLRWWPCEVNPKQTQLTVDAPHGNGINLPFFGAGVPSEIVRYTMPPEEMWKADSSSEAAPVKNAEIESPDSESGYWWDEPLLAMLEAYRNFFPDFNFRRCGSYYEVPCPGNPLVGGWLDGSRHSTEEPLLSDKAVVFIKHGWPKFKCFHAHCDGAYGEKKTINDWRHYFDPGYVFFDIDKWLDACAERAQ